ncbi:uncharacterized protein isoform X1 [Rhodnius prolixus]|uniref:uncharacterized protein isoform X1 n=1 Tax=Rhodnius prolixus TaxID=13249 RepID=UPI003D18C2D8
MASAEALMEIRAPDLLAFVIFVLLTRHVDPETLRRFERAHIDVEFPTVGHLKVFLRNTLHALRLAPPQPLSPRARTPPRRPTVSARSQRRESPLKSLPPAYAATPRESTSHAGAPPTPPVTATPSGYKCAYCPGGKHSIRQCAGFKALPVPQRRAFAVDTALCRNCLSAAHSTEACRSPYRCLHCSWPHHTLVHPEGSGKGSSRSAAPPRALASPPPRARASPPTAPPTPPRARASPSPAPSTPPPRATSPLSVEGARSASPPGPLQWADCPSPPLDLTPPHSAAFISANPIPGAVYEQGRLTNIDVVVPDGWPTRALVLEDLDRYSNLCSFLMSKKSSFVSTVDYTSRACSK